MAFPSIEPIADAPDEFPFHEIQTGVVFRDHQNVLFLPAIALDRFDIHGFLLESAQG
jgi:hypothetical protein